MTRRRLFMCNKNAVNEHEMKGLWEFLENGVYIPPIYNKKTIQCICDKKMDLIQLEIVRCPNCNKVNSVWGNLHRCGIFCRAISDSFDTAWQEYTDQV